LDQKAAQLSYCILQAQEYFQAAESVTINTSPLLHYFYGMLSLAKAVIVANDPDKLLGDINYHSLKHDRGNRAGTLDDQVAILTGVVFDDFVNVVAGFRLPHRAAFRFKDVLSISPELSNIYGRYYPNKSRCVSVDLKLLSQNPYQLKLCPLLRTKDEAFARIPELARDFDAEPGLLHGQALQLVSKSTLTKAPEYFRHYEPVGGGRYVVGSLPFAVDGVSDSKYLSPLVSDYISMYVLSYCVRVQQELWGSIVEGRQSGIPIGQRNCKRIRSCPIMFLSASSSPRSQSCTTSAWAGVR